MRFSAASGRGLIEAGWPARRVCRERPFSAASGRGLIEARSSNTTLLWTQLVFRGIGPRPH